MNNGPGDTMSVAADTLDVPVQQEEFSLGRIIPVRSLTRCRAVRQEQSASGLSIDHIAGLRRVDGEAEAVRTDQFGYELYPALPLSADNYGPYRIRPQEHDKRPLINQLQEARRGDTSRHIRGPFLAPDTQKHFHSAEYQPLFSHRTPDQGTGHPGPFRRILPDLPRVLAGSFLAALLIRHLTSIVLAEITGLQSLFREYMNIVYNTWFACSLFLVHT